MSAVLLPRMADHAGARAWLITFVDIILLLLTFFVLMYAMARPDPARYAPIVQSYTEAFSAPPAEAEPGAPKPRSYVRDVSVRGCRNAAFDHLGGGRPQQNQVLNGVAAKQDKTVPSINAGRFDGPQAALTAHGPDLILANAQALHDPRHSQDQPNDEDQGQKAAKV
ncbi:MAG: hypothetical protein EXR11_07550 [Rhodospirillaceae bacterium]|nr:hypothetical protein [Rhodospirillaceae bacterium]